LLPFVLKRLLNVIPLFVGATLLAFVVLQVGPGNTAQMLRNNLAMQQSGEADRIIREFGLDRPVMVQYVAWLSHAAIGDLGSSFTARRPVRDVLAAPLRNSLLLVLTSLVLVCLIAVPLGVYCALHENRLPDRLVSSASYVFLGFPAFFLALLVVYLVLQLRLRTGLLLVPVGGMTSVDHESLPAWRRVLDIAWHAAGPVLTIVAVQVALLARLVRAQMLDFLEHDFIRTARAKGLSGARVVYKHALRNALTPFVASVGGALPALIGGAGLVEIVFSWPGLTPLVVNAINAKDFFLFIGLIALTSVLLIVGNIISDLLVSAVDPRVRYA
jgi:peptide/nickel transport system permease protein